MQEIYTIGFTKKSAENFFSILIRNKIDIILDVRLNNTSQLAGFSKYPDVEYFLNIIASIQYMSDVTFAPTEDILKAYKSKKITWDDYVVGFNKLMVERDIENHIKNKYITTRNKKLCLLCSEDKAEHCHRLLVANLFNKTFGDTIVHL